MSGPLHRAALRAYTSNGWPLTEIDDGAGFTLDIEGTEAAWSALAITDDGGGVFAFYSLAPVDAAADKGGLDRMAEYLHRANRGLLGGSFELDYDTGEVRLYTGLEFATLPPALLEDDDLLEAIVLDLSAANVGVFDRYLSGLVAVTLGRIAPAEIIAEIESRPTGPDLALSRGE